MSNDKSISIKGARVHNLKSVDVEIPHSQFVVVTGLSGSGKSTLAFDTIFAEGQRRYVESLSAYARQFLGRVEKPDVDFIEGIAPAIAIEQKVSSRNPRSTVGTSTEIYEYLKLLFARIGHTFSPKSGKEVKRHTVDDVITHITSLPEGTTAVILVPLETEQDKKNKKTNNAYKDFKLVSVIFDEKKLEIIGRKFIEEFKDSRYHQNDLGNNNDYCWLPSAFANTNNYSFIICFYYILFCFKKYFFIII